MGKRGPMPTKGDAKQRLGDLSIHKGSTPDGVPVIMWDCIQDCEGDTCRVYDICPYEKYGKCRIRKEYLDYVYRHFIGSVHATDSMALFKIGMIIVPLFSQLISLKIASHNTFPTFYDSKGMIRVNPLYREIRETLRAVSGSISDIMNSLDVKKGDGGVGDDLLGNSDYYDNLFKGEAPRVDRKMRNRV